ncbi:MAG: YfhO family protein, partial [Firmicutes bacterium]|nr:YfhO family protein [Bacillota bacterium]
TLLYFSYLLCLVSNYYLAFMTGIFAALYFVFFCIVKKQKSFIKPLFLCALGALLAGGTAAVILLPAFANVSSGYVDMVQTSAFKPFIEWKPNEIAQGLALFQETSATYVTIHAFAGVFPLVLVFMLPLNKNIPKRELIAAFIFLLFMLISLLVRPFYLVWHIFRDPTSFYGRFVYCTDFLLTALAARCISTLELRIKKLLPIPALIVFLISFYGVSVAPSVWLLKMLLAVMVLVIAYTLLIYFDKKKNILACAVLFEAVLMCLFGMAKLKTAHGASLRADDFKIYDDTKALVSQIDDDGFYRMTDVNSVAVNRPLTMGYNSLETFSSQTNQSSLEKLSQLGLWCPYDYRISANYFNNIVAEGLFGVKYIMAVGKDSKAEDGLGRTVYQDGGFTTSLRLNSDNYELIAENEHGYLYKNKTAFPLMFGVNEAAITSNERFYPANSDEYDGLANQIYFLNDMFGTEHKFYSLVEYDWIPQNVKNIDISYLNTPELNAIYCIRQYLELTGSNKDRAANDDEMGSLSYIAEADEDAEYLFHSFASYDVRDGAQTTFAYSANGVMLKNMYNEHNGILLADIGPYKKGDKIEIDLQTMRSLFVMAPSIVKFNREEFNDVYERAQAAALKGIKQENGSITAVSDFDKETLVFSSLSYDNGFHVYIDGVEAEKVKIADAFLGFYAPAGTHDIKISYVSPGFKAGAAISVIFAVLSAIVLYVNKKNKLSFMAASLRSPVWQKAYCFSPNCSLVCVHQRYTCKSVGNANFVRSSHGQSPHCGF